MFINLLKYLNYFGKVILYILIFILLQNFELIIKITRLFILL